MSDTTVQAPMSRDTMSSSGNVRKSPAQAAGMIRSSTARSTSVRMRMGRLGLRSSQTPTNRLMKRYGSVSDATRTPISNGVAERETAAISGTATAVTLDPNSEAVSPSHRFRKSACRHRLDFFSVTGPALRP